jgi:hypothetical protein
LALSLHSSAAAYRLDHPVIVTVEIRNISGHVEHMLLESRDSAYDFSVIDVSSGDRLPRRASRTQLDSVGGPSSGRPLPAGRSYFVNIDLNDLYGINHPGTYEVTLLSASVGTRPIATRIGPSPTVTIQITP